MYTNWPCIIHIFMFIGFTNQQIAGLQQLKVAEAPLEHLAHDRPTGT